jgi:putative transposase
MEELLTDRGFVFYSWQGANRFEKYLEVERIDHTHASAHHPQTLGKIEALNGHLRRELIQQEHFSGVEEAGGAISGWIFRYNYERTHQGLGGVLFPADRFHGLTDVVLSNLGKTMDCNGGQTYVTSKPRANNTILCFRDKPDINGLVSEAAFIIKSIRAKYGMK